MKKIAVLLLVALIALQGAALAKEVAGTVLSVNSEKNEIELAPADPLAEPSKLSLDENVKLPEGVLLADLKDEEIVATTDDVTEKVTSIALAEEAKVVEAVIPIAPVPVAPVKEEVKK